MCHGITWQPKPKKERPYLNRLTAERFERYFQIASEMGFQSISYEDLAKWKAGEIDLPNRPIMFDFDHPDWSIGRVVEPIMSQFGYQGNLFINTSPMEKGDTTYRMTWEEIQHLVDLGWHIGAHTHNHYKLDFLTKKDPTGGLIQEQLQICDYMIHEYLGIMPKDFAYTYNTWSEVAEREVKKRYRFARLWVVSEPYLTDKGPVRYADLVGVEGDDEIDGGPPYAVRYITRDTDPYKLPSMELEHFIYDFDAFRSYLSEALDQTALEHGR
jgi:peptidoglycan/xylan/chitin deacetylase (PgdA/CDA1 family)